MLKCAVSPDLCCSHAQRMVVGKSSDHYLTGERHRENPFFFGGGGGPSKFVIHEPASLAQRLAKM